MSATPLQEPLSLFVYLKLMRIQRLTVYRRLVAKIYD